MKKEYKTHLVLFLLIFVLSGCGNKDDRYVDHSPLYAAEQPDIRDEKTQISRTRSIRENMNDYFEKVNTESRPEIHDILDSEKEFLVSDEGETRIVYVYLLSDKGYEKGTFFVNYSQQENVAIHLQDDVTEMYVLCPEYTNVEALTKSDSSNAQEYSLYVVDEAENTQEVGGDLRYRIFDVDLSARKNMKFELCDAHESDDYNVYGGFVIQLDH